MWRRSHQGEETRCVRWLNCPPPFQVTSQTGPFPGQHGTVCGLALGQSSQPACLCQPPSPETKDKAGTQPDTQRSMFITPSFPSSLLSLLNLYGHCVFLYSDFFFSFVFHPLFSSSVQYVRLPLSYFARHLTLIRAFSSGTHTQMYYFSSLINTHIVWLNMSPSHTHTCTPFSLWCACLSSCHCVWAPHQTSCLTNKG